VQCLTWERSRPKSGMAERLEVEQVLSDPAASFWLKDALRSALDRDPVDAANDAEVLFRLLDERCHKILSQGWPGCTSLRSSRKSAKNPQHPARCGCDMGLIHGWVKDAREILRRARVSVCYSSLLGASPVVFISQLQIG